jgi:hypothetical protein
MMSGMFMYSYTAAELAWLPCLRNQPSRVHEAPGHGVHL